MAGKREGKARREGEGKGRREKVGDHERERKGKEGNRRRREKQEKARRRGMRGKREVATANYMKGCIPDEARTIITKTTSESWLFRRASRALSRPRLLSANQSAFILAPDLSGERSL